MTTLILQKIPFYDNLRSCVQIFHLYILPADRNADQNADRFAESAQLADRNAD